jgi:plastocyanin
MLFVRLVLTSAFVALAIGCSGSYSSPTPAPSPTPTPVSPSPSGPSAAVTIPRGAEALGRSAYNPAELTVDVGSTVTWTNTDVVSHTSTSDASGWNSGTIAPGGQFSFTFPTAGTFSYHCAIHPGMVGTVVAR